MDDRGKNALRILITLANMKGHEAIFKQIPLDQIQRDPDQPRKDFGTDGDENRLWVSIKDLGVQQPLAVSEMGDGKYIILDGHRRYICAQRLKLKSVPCRVYPKMDIGEFELIRFEIQNNRRPWKPLERSEAIERIKTAKRFDSNADLATFLHLSTSLVSNSLQLRKQKLEYIEMMESYDLAESYRIEFVRLKPKIRKVRNFEADEIIRIIFSKVQCNVIKSAKDFRKLGRIFLRATANEEELYQFLSNPDMTVTELDQNTLQSGFSLLIEELIKKIGSKKKDGIEFSSEEKTFLTQLKDFLNTAL